MPEGTKILEGGWSANSEYFVLQYADDFKRVSAAANVYFDGRYLFFANKTDGVRIALDYRKLTDTERTDYGFKATIPIK